ncbi:hypothetical protein [Spirosoma radiotolerans]|uniref:hypothetical protein n=1 Tax=Spirosoma radiotolerans TaxID=1379870 RepID=UPI000A923990|nr:hypothetical protein [Spirosoma radiotolerans]
MKHPSNLVLRLPSPDQMHDEKTSVDQATQLLEVAPHASHSLQDFAQLLARYKRAGYEAIEHLNSAHHEAQ